MATRLRLKWVIIFLMIAFSVNANKVVVFGTVKFSNGAIAANYPLTIQPDTTICQVSQSVFTNQNGNFETSIDCDQPILKTILSFLDCDHQLVQVVKEVPANFQVQYNITLCTPTNCHADFNFIYSTSNPLTLQFNSNKSFASGPAPDEITSRVWSWGDGSAITEGNKIEPAHTYPHGGTYNVCLKIITRNGCYSYSCKNVTVNSPDACKAYYAWVRGASNPRLFYFIDSSKTPTGDSIISRWWVWNDGTITDGNLKNPTHTFPKDSTYNVCLKITTKNGCVSYSCQELIVRSSTGECKANYGWAHNTSNSGKEFHFTDSSKTAGDDSIITRRWAWGDGTVTEGNIHNPAHTFPKDSIYNVCLRITTRNGCVSNSCQKVTVGSTVTECRAGYGWVHSSSNTRLFYFIDSSKTPDGDSITSRRWVWNDGTITDGNIKNPTHTFLKDSTYNVCLKITTKNGCNSYSCQKVMVTSPSRDCKTNFGWLHSSSTTGREFHFIDSSKTAPGDSITSRRWIWNDGTVTEGNIAKPTHTFPKDSIYKVCLVITTHSGCKSDYCQQVIVSSVPKECRTSFAWVHSNSDGREFHFTDSSKTAPGDSITSRRWIWNDGTVTEGNIAKPTHTFPKDSTYKVCLVITTHSGCKSDNCQQVIVSSETKECRTSFAWVRVNSDGREFHFADSSKTATGDSIITRLWTWGDGKVTDGNLKNPSHEFPKDSTYKVCLIITTKGDCKSYYCQEVTVRSATNECRANFGWVRGASNPGLFYFIDSSKTLTGDSIISRWWVWNDGTITDGNLKTPTHTFHKDSTYRVCLKITTKNGCISYSCQELKVTASSSGASCIAYYLYELVPVDNPNAFGVRFNSTASSVAAGDSIIHRYWHFGDGSTMDGNVIKPYHLYLQNGQYEVCLVIVTKLGCEKKFCRLITQVTAGINCQASFNYENSGNQKLRFNSSSSYHQIQQDSIIKRNWNFGDGTSLFGNTIAPAHEYKIAGTYTTCLTIVTQSGCESRVCNQVKVDGLVIPDSTDFTILNLYPNPVKDYLYVTTWSKHMNVPTELAVYDINGIKRWSRLIILPQGNSTWTVPTGFLLPGSYIITLTNTYGILHKTFLK